MEVNNELDGSCFNFKDLPGTYWVQPSKQPRPVFIVLYITLFIIRYIAPYYVLI